MHSSKVKNAILNGEVIEANAWSISIDADDQVLVFPPKGAGFKTSLGNIDRAVSDFCKKAEMPIPGVNQSVPPKDTSATDMGDDSGAGEGFKSPSINKQDKPDGAKSSTDLGDDTSANEGFKSPSVIKRQPVKSETGGLPDSELGSDSSVGEPDFHDKSVNVQEDGRVGGRRQAIQIPMDDVDFDINIEPETEPFEADSGEEEYDREDEAWVERELAAGNLWAWCQVEVVASWTDPESGRTFTGSDYLSGCNYESEEQFKELGGYYDDMKAEAYEDLLIKIEDADTGMRGLRGNKIQDTFSQEKTPDFYREHKTPSASLLEGIMDPEAWAANNQGVVAQYLNTSDPDRDLSDPHRQTLDTPPLVGYEDEAYEDFASDEITSKKKRSVRRQRADGFTPPSKSDTKPTVSDPKVEDKTDEVDRKKELDKATGYAFGDKDSGRRRARITLESGDFGTYLILDDLSGKDLLIQDEADIEDAATTFGWQPEQGSPVDWLDAHLGESVEDPGYFPSYRGVGERQAGPKLREKWDDAGGYNRDMEAESAEELYHMVRSFGSEDDYDWDNYKPSMPMAPEGIEEGNLAGGGKFEGPEGLGSEARRKVADERAEELVDQWVNGNREAVMDEVIGDTLLSAQVFDALDEYNRTVFLQLAEIWPHRGARKLCAIDDKEAVDDAAKEYWKGYYKDDDYGKKMVNDGDMGGGPRGTKPKKRDEKKDKDTKKESRKSIRARVKANIKRRASNRRKAQQSQNPAVQPAGQNALEGAPLAPTSDLGGPPATGQAPATPQAPAGKPKPEMPPGTGDSGLQALGWPPEDIQVMTEDDKQKILQIRLNKPGTKPPKPGEKPGADPTKAPPATGQPAAPAAPAAPAVPGEQPAAPVPPTPTQARLMARRMDLRLRTRRAQQALEADPQAAPAAPEATPPAAPSAGPTAVPAAPVDEPGTGSTDEQALSILQEVRKQEVSATDSIGVSIQKNQILAQRLMTELGLSMEEARKLYGVKDTSKLFQ